MTFPSPSAPGGKRVAQTVKETHSAIYLHPNIHLDATGGHPFGCGSRPALLHPFGCAARAPGYDAGAVLSADAEFAQRVGCAETGEPQHLQPHCHRGNLAEGEFDQFIVADRLSSPASRHARPDKPGDVRAHRLFVVAAAEASPPDMLPWCVVLQCPHRTATRNRAVCSPLAVPLSPAIESRAPVIRRTILRVGQTQPARHRLTVLPCEEEGGAGSLLGRGSRSCRLGLVGQELLNSIKRFERSRRALGRSEAVGPVTGGVRVAKAGFLQLVALALGFAPKPVFAGLLCVFHTGTVPEAIPV